VSIDWQWITEELWRIDANLILFGNVVTGVIIVNSSLIDLDFVVGALMGKCMLA